MVALGLIVLKYTRVKRHLIFLTTSYPRSAEDEASIFVARLAESLKEEGREIQVIVPLDQMEPSSDSIRGVQIQRYRYRWGSDPGVAFDAGVVANLKNRPWQFWQLITILAGQVYWGLKKRRSDSVFICNWILSAFSGCILRAITGCPVLYVVRGQEMRIANSLIGRFLFWVVTRLSDRVICVSEHFSEELKRLFPKLNTKICCIKNGVGGANTGQIKDIVIFKPTRPYFIMIGTVTEVKDILGAIELMKSGFADVYDLVVVGRLSDQRYIESLQKRLRGEHIESLVHFVGPIAPSLVPNYLRNAKAYLSTSKHEGMPNSLLEAMALGLICVVSDIPAHREAVNHLESGIILSDDAASNIEVIKSVLADPSKCANIGMAAQLSLKERTWSKCAQKYLEVIDQI